MVNKDVHITTITTTNLLLLLLLQQLICLSVEDVVAAWARETAAGHAARNPPVVRKYAFTPMRYFPEVVDVRQPW